VHGIHPFRRIRPKDPYGYEIMHKIIHMILEEMGEEINEGTKIPKVEADVKQNKGGR